MTILLDWWLVVHVTGWGRVCWPSRAFPISQVGGACADSSMDTTAMQPSPFFMYKPSGTACDARHYARAWATCLGIPLAGSANETVGALHFLLRFLGTTVLDCSTYRLTWRVAYRWFCYLPTPRCGPRGNMYALPPPRHLPLPCLPRMFPAEHCALLRDATPLVTFPTLLPYRFMAHHAGGWAELPPYAARLPIGDSPVPRAWAFRKHTTYATAYKLQRAWFRVSDRGRLFPPSPERLPHSGTPDTRC